ncbi:MAG: ATP-binding cassette domain-containing protein [Clostridia bacterium]|nr:ATP-binding cassette domain-containing protein [Clostridia bacterium]
MEGIEMLPLDRLTEEAKYGLEAHGIREADLVVALQLDMDTKGQFGETWICLDREKRMHVLSVTGTEGTSRASGVDHSIPRRVRKNAPVDAPFSQILADKLKDAPLVTYSIDELQNPSIDNLVTSERFLASLNGITTVIAQSTNARKAKMYAFLDLMDRVKEGVETAEDDPIFDQFNAKCPKCGAVYPDQIRKICPNCMEKSGTMVRLIKYLRGFAKPFALTMLCNAFGSAIGVAGPLIIGPLMFDHVISPTGDLNKGWGPFDSGEKMVIALTIFYIFLILVQAAVRPILRERISARMSNQMLLKMKSDIFTNMQRLSLSYFNNNQTGKLITRVNYDAEILRSFFINEVPMLLSSAADYLGILIICLIMNWKLTLIIFIPVPVAVFIIKFITPKLHRMYTKVWRSSSSMSAHLSDSLSGIRVVKSFSKEAEESNRFHKIVRKLYKANMDANLIAITVFPVIGLLIGLSGNAIWGFGGLDVIGGKMTYGEFEAFWNYVGQLFAPLTFFTNFINTYTNAANSARRMFEVLDAVPDLNEAENPIDLDDTMKGDIVFDHVNFHYVPNRPILRDLSMHISAGDNIGLVGHTGSGKTTITNLISRLYDVNTGKILIDGHNIRDIKMSSLRKNIAIVSQEIYLFRGTITDNIRFAKPEASMDEVIRAARIANAHDFILSLPDGYNTLVGTGSRSLSGGQKQRISIARAVLLEPRILILDEATAAMDTETERLIQEAMTDLVKGRTTISIAHRLSTLKDCNYLYTIDDGVIAEEGTHTELLAKHGTYYRLYTIQTEAMAQIISDD